MAKKNILITGPPRSGKSTLIEKLVNRIGRPVTGFFTREIREKGRRVGFSILTLDGKEATLAHENVESPFKVGKYGIQVQELDRIAVPSMIPSSPKEVVIIDEIGKMECLSPLFRKTLIETLDSRNPVIGSVALKGGPFIEKIKEREDVHLIFMSEKNRDSLAVDLLHCIPAL